tara:strand:+ start:752 stop:1807 length:1056 start_codon:yes stop_codon:yes gene_type:complete
MDQQNQTNQEKDQKKDQNDSVSKYESTSLRKAFRDIKKGFSKIKFLGNYFYLKHISFDDQVDIDEVYDKYLEEAKERGVPTHEETLERLLEEGEWSKKQENRITQQEDFIQGLKNTKKVQYLKKEIKRLNSDIEKGEEKLNQLKNERAALFSRTAESYAEERVNDFYILRCLYKDSSLKNSAYSEEEFDSIYSEDLFAIIKEYNTVYAQINDDSIQHIVLQDFYNLFMPFAENAQEFYGKPICDLSYNQLKLLIYSRYFKNIFNNNDKMPEHIKKDPDKIIDYVNANENVKKIREKNAEKDYSAESIVGASEEDLEYIGVKSKEEKTLSLSEEAKKKGGSLSMDDMMKLFG